jgi:phosphoribosylanthranilate isomerase
VKTRVKICGITRDEDAHAAIRAGANAIGFVMWQSSPRAVTADQAAAIAAEAGMVARVGVFVDPTRDEVVEAVRHARLDAVQLHGDEQVDDFLGCGAPIIKAVRLGSEADVDRVLALPAGVTVLVDTQDPDRHGGTGRVANWALARSVASRRRVMLAGGLNSGNVARAIAEVRPWAVDVSSGVERAPGLKDPAAIVAFCHAVERANLEAV